MVCHRAARRTEIRICNLHVQLPTEPEIEIDRLAKVIELGNVPEAVVEQARDRVAELLSLIAPDTVATSYVPDPGLKGGLG